MTASPKAARLLRRIRESTSLQGVVQSVWMVSSAQAATFRGTKTTHGATSNGGWPRLHDPERILGLTATLLGQIEFFPHCRELRNGKLQILPAVSRR